MRVPNPRGLLVLDGAGMIFEAVTRLDRTRPTEDNKSLTDAQRVFATYSGFWGRYKLDPQAQTITARAEGAVSPAVTGRDVTRSFAVQGDRLTLTASSIEPHQRGITRWVWERVPPVENLSPGYRKVVGFWQHVVEKRVNLTLKTESAHDPWRRASSSTRRRDTWASTFRRVGGQAVCRRRAHRCRGARRAARLRRLLRRAHACIPARCFITSSAASARRGRRR